MRDSKWLGRLTLALLVAVAACSGASTSDFLPASGAQATGGPTDGGATADGDQASEPGPGGKDGGKDARKDGTSSVEDADGVDASQDDADTTDASAVDATPAGDPGIFCGEVSNQRNYCDVTAQSCCIRSVSGNLELTCKPKSGSGSNCTGMTVPCSDTHDCNGKICCATYDNVLDGYKSVSCAQTCDADNSLVTEYRLCDPNAAVDECAAGGQSCQASSAIDGWYVCK